jgi:hypothetical protein
VLMAALFARLLTYRRQQHVYLVVASPSVGEKNRMKEPILSAASARRSGGNAAPFMPADDTSFAPLVVGTGERMLDGLMVVFSKLLRPELAGQVIDCPCEAERQLVTVGNGRAGIDSTSNGSYVSNWASKGAGMLATVIQPRSISSSTTCLRSVPSAVSTILTLSLPTAT